MNILLLSAYDAASHRYWREGLVRAFPEYHWTVLTLPPRFFNWRIRGNSLSWAFGEREVLQQSYDVLVATSMVDLSSLRGFVPELTHVPTLVYCHENQFAYPLSETRQFEHRLEPQVVNLYTLLCADRVLFNSEFNRQTCLQGVQALLAKMPDYVPAQVLDRLVTAQVVPVPLIDALFQLAYPPHCHSDTLDIVWNHRWEYDKGPEQLLRLVQALQAKDVPFRLAVVGEQFRQIPAALQQLKSFMDANCPQALWRWGYIDDHNAYLQLLSQADVVLSTALHDFQGIAVLEAVALGCVPLVPDRLAYPQWFDAEYCYPSSPDQPEREIAALLARIEVLVRRKKAKGLTTRVSVDHFAWQALRESYRQCLQSLAS